MLLISHLFIQDFILSFTSHAHTGGSIRGKLGVNIFLKQPNNKPATQDFLALVLSVNVCEYVTNSLLHSLSESVTVDVIH